MKVLHLTDIHCTLSWLDWVAEVQQRYDAIVISGDLADWPKIGRGLTYKEQWRLLAEKLARITVPTFIAGGNHDVDPAEVANKRDLPGKPAALLHAAVSGLTNFTVDGGSAVLGGYRFVCSPFVRPQGVAREVMQSPEPVILVAHVGPAGVAVSEDLNGDGGDDNIGALSFRMPAGSMILSGHMHLRRSWRASLGQAMCFNPGNRFGVSVPHHVTIDTATGEAVLHRDGRTESYHFPVSERALAAA